LLEGAEVTRHLITGGGGFIGSALAHRLVALGHEVTVLDRFSRGKQARVPELAEVRRGDIRNFNDVWEAARYAQVVWHLAYIQGTQTFYAEPKEVIDVALSGITNVLTAIEHADTRPDFFLVSSSEVYQDPPPAFYPTAEDVPLSVPDVTNPRYTYGGGKIASELATLAYGQAGVLGRAVVVRPHNIYGPDMGNEHVIPEFANRMMDLRDEPGIGPKEFRIQGTGAETRSFCHIADCVDGLEVLLDHAGHGQVYHLGNPAEEHSIGRVAFMVADWFDQDITLKKGRRPKGSPTRRAPDIGKMRDLGFEPRVGLNEGLGPTLKWYADRREAAVA
jgi:nucleoside-diphosphate-sugar epimerase